MANFAKTFDLTKPAGSDAISTLDTTIQDLSAALDERMDLEHYKFSDSVAGVSKDGATVSGRHRPGYVSAVLTVAAIANLPASPLDGVIYYVSDLNLLAVRTGGAWKYFASDIYNRRYLFNVYSAADQAVSALGTTSIIFGTEATDADAVYVHTTGIFTAKVAGFYWFNFATHYNLTASHTLGTTMYSYLYGSYDGAGGAEYARGNIVVGTGTTVDQRSNLSYITNLAVGGFMQVKAYNLSAASVDVKAGSTKTFFQGYLLSRV